VSAGIGQRLSRAKAISRKIDAHLVTVKWLAANLTNEGRPHNGTDLQWNRLGEMQVACRLAQEEIDKLQAVVTS